MIRGEGLWGKEGIRQAMPQDIDAFVDIYIECFPERVTEIFGGPQRRVFIRDYLLFYLALGAASNWVYVKDGTVVGFIMVPWHIPSWKAMLADGQLFWWIVHFLMGDYGFPVHLVKKFFRGGFAFTSDPVIKCLQGKPYIHLIAVKATDGKELPRGLLGIGRQLMQWAIADQRRKGVHFWWGVVQPSGSRFLPIWRRIGFKIRPLSNGASLGWMDDQEDNLRHSECR
jgi:hypothetical protein